MIIIVRYFHVCDGGLIPDIMHDLLEGALQYEVKLLLRHFVKTECYFSLDTFNSRLINLELGYMETKDRPTPIADSTLTSSGHSLKQAGKIIFCLLVCYICDKIYSPLAAQMWLLGRILPLIVGDLVPDDDERWLNYLRMMEIVDLLFCSQISEDSCAYLAALINDHHREFTELYPNASVLPKMHFMVHMARLILR